MSELNIDLLLEHYHQQLKRVTLRFKRYLYSKINWEARIIGIKGARGVGKTTLMLQRILEQHHGSDEALYVSLDDLWFSANSVVDLIRYLYSNGVKYLYIDEVHKYPQWTTLLKNIYDFYPEMKIVYSGSALLAIDHSIADLSRRQSLYELRGMSFREYLEYEDILKVPVQSLENILHNHSVLSMEITSAIPVQKHFTDYLDHGFYPSYKQDRADFAMHIENVVRLVIELDIPLYEEVTSSTIAHLKTLTMIIASSTPFQPNISSLAEKLGCSRELCIKMLYLLDRAGIIQILTNQANNYKQLSGIKKVLGGDTNILHALTKAADIGTVRETFFVNQLRAVSHVSLPVKNHGDFLIDNQYLFEVGGPNKKFSQIADIPNSYLAVDSIDTGWKARIPLYLFGMLY